MFTTETLEGVATPVTVPLELLLEEDPPLQPASSNANAVKQMPIIDVAENFCLVFMGCPFIRLFFDHEKK